jgi:hypothetical protein
MKLNFAVALSILLAVLFMGTVGAFLIYVPALTVFTVASVLIGLCLMFALGLAAGRQWKKAIRFQHRADLSIVR